MSSGAVYDMSRQRVILNMIQALNIDTNGRFEDFIVVLSLKKADLININVCIVCGVPLVMC